MPDAPLIIESVRMTVVLITGAAKRIGRFLAEYCLKRGYDVAVHCHTSIVEAEVLVTHLAARYPKQRVQVFQADLRSCDAINHLMNTVNTVFGQCDVLINNASTFFLDSLESTTEELWDSHNTVNVKAPLFLAKAFVKAFNERVVDEHQSSEMTATIINMIDQRVLNVTPHFLTYSVSKFALWGLTQVLARELAPRIRVNAIAPGAVLPSLGQTEDQLYEKSKQFPLGHPIELDDLGRALTFILTTKSITGQLFALDAGQHMGWRF